MTTIAQQTGGEKRNSRIHIFPYFFKVHRKPHEDHKIVNYKISLNKFLKIKIQSMLSDKDRIKSE